MCLMDDNRGVLGLSILVQSSIKNTYELQQYVFKFVNEILKENIANLDEKTFSQYKNALYNIKIQKDRNLASESNRFYG
jgi:secreted Zn-dependent insulinase-like peptidase